jgi:hypothetical protein
MLATVSKKSVRKLRQKMMPKEEAENSFPVFHRNGRIIL